MTQQPNVDHGGDVVAFLTAQHERIKELLAQVASSVGAQRERAFFDLRRLLAVHETAEEEIVHPRARRATDDGSAVVRARLDEEHDAKVALSELEKMDVDSAEFGTAFAKLRGAVIAHAAAEEKLEFSALATQLDDAVLRGMRRTVQAAEAIAPTRPHPGVESASANMLAGPFVSMLDRARDAITEPK